MSRRAPGLKFDYVVLEPFRYMQRRREVGEVLNPRRLDMGRFRLDRLYCRGFLGLLDPDAVPVVQPSALASNPEPETLDEVSLLSRIVGFFGGGQGEADLLGLEE